ncbi:universal stress protein [Aldersonia sp. NBC_00410]|uniref:universal stress protein n=1 Tax=Aldersonia sp. NBC_00410 TaxID=2975954 RepID=UPI002258BC1E|nr:universal stress protein [Aldersonia sp. NBC_00410]MCX5042733.1 universal stress protein [Aldersonia sp. NBC_00410]
MCAAEIRRGIVAGIDGSDTALDAARWAASVALQFGEPLYLTHLVPKPKHPEREQKDEELQHELAEGEQLLAAAEAVARAAAPGVVTECRLEYGQTAPALVTISEGARMLVLGSAGTSEMRAMFVGSDVVRVANHARCPVVVWRENPDGEITTGLPVVVGVDGSSLSDVAVAHAFEFASFFRVPVIAVHAWSEQSGLGYAESRRFVNWSSHEQRETAVMSEALAGWGEKFPDVDVERFIERGSARGALLRHSTQAQLVVVGSHGRTPIMGALLGSTTQNLMHHSRCPVLICRDGDRADGE